MLNALFLAECPTSLVRQLRDSDRRPMPDRLWKALADAGIFGLLLPEAYGGAGGTLSDLGVFCVEAGRALCPTVVHATLQAALAIHLLGGPDQHAAWLPSLSAGTLCTESDPGTSITPHAASLSIARSCAESRAVISGEDFSSPATVTIKLR